MEHFRTNVRSICLDRRWSRRVWQQTILAYGVATNLADRFNECVSYLKDNVFNIDDKQLVRLDKPKAAEWDKLCKSHGIFDLQKWTAKKVKEPDFPGGPSRGAPPVRPVKLLPARQRPENARIG